MLIGSLFSAPLHFRLLKYSRFVDRDMTMRYHWGLGIGHTYSHGKAVGSHPSQQTISSTESGTNPTPREAQTMPQSDISDDGMGHTYSLSQAISSHPNEHPTPPPQAGKESGPEFEEPQIMLQPDHSTAGVTYQHGEGVSSQTSQHSTPPSVPSGTNSIPEVAQITQSGCSTGIIGDTQVSDAEDDSDASDSDREAEDDQDVQDDEDIEFDGTTTDSDECEDYDGGSSSSLELYDTYH